MGCNYQDISVIDKILNLAIAISSILTAAILVMVTLYIEEKKKRIAGNVWEKLYRKSLLVIFSFLVINVVIGAGAFTYILYKFYWLYDILVISFYLQMLLILVVAFFIIKKR